MFFQNIVPTDSITAWVGRQVDAMRAGLKYGFDIEIKPHKKTRTTQQNRFLMAVMQNIVRFYQDTGFIPDDLAPWVMRTDILKEYWKAKFGVMDTHKLDTQAFGEFIDKIQAEMVAQSGGEYEIITPPDNYLEKTGLI